VHVKLLAAQAVHPVTAVQILQSVEAVAPALENLLLAVSQAVQVLPLK